MLKNEKGRKTFSYFFVFGLVPYMQLLLNCIELAKYDAEIRNPTPRATGNAAIDSSRLIGILPKGNYKWHPFTDVELEIVTEGYEDKGKGKTRFPK
jgi:hypothetical protein